MVSGTNIPLKQYTRKISREVGIGGNKEELSFLGNNNYC